MKERSYLEKSERQFYPSRKVWVEEYTYPTWIVSLHNGCTVYTRGEKTVPAHWRKQKDYDNPWVEETRFRCFSKYHYYRQVRTFAERRDSFIEPELVRAKRNWKNIPTSWDDGQIGKFKGWKDTHKCRKQWMKNL